MKKIRTLIVDDEPLARDGIRVLLARDPEFEVVGESGHGAEAVREIRARTPDLLFLDVQMPEMNGFEVLRRIDPAQMPVVIFVTAFDQYALDAFEFHALDYLLKPFDDERFERALKRARNQVRQQQAHELSSRVVALVRDYPQPALREAAAPSGGTRHLERLAVRSAGRVYFLKTCEIDWIEAADYYVKLHVGGKAHLLRETMSKLEQKLDPERFLRIHRSTIVNLDRIRELRPLAQGECLVRLDDGTELRMSRSRKERLHAVLDQAT